MKNRILKFSVCNQHISSDDICVVADSKNYLLALFNFDPSWEGVAKTAVFSQGDSVYNMLLTDDMCRVPAEVISGDGFYVSVFGGDLITADRIKVAVTPSGLLEGAAPPEPTQSIYDQLLTLVLAESAAAEDSATAAEKSAQSAMHSAESAAADKETLLGNGTLWVFDGGDSSGEVFISQMADDALSDTSVNAVQNRVIKSAIDTAKGEAFSAAEDAKNDAITAADEAFLPHLEENVADYVIETGVDTGWRYRKYKSGLFDAWLRYSFTSVNCSKNFLNGTYYSDVIVPAVPSWMTYVSCASVEGGSTSYVLYPNIMNITDGTIRMLIMCNSSSLTSVSGELYIIAHGSWS